MKNVKETVGSSQLRVDRLDNGCVLKYAVCFLFLSLNCQLLTVNSLFSSNNNGTSGGMILRLNPSAQAAGMSEAMTSVGENLNSMDFNPAGISQLAGYTAYRFSFSHVEYLEDIKYEDLKFASYFKQLKGYLGFNLKFLNTSDVRRDIWGKSSGEFTNRDIVFGVSYAKATKTADFGVQLKYINEKLADEKSTGALAADAGFIYSAYTLPFDLGVSLRNIGSSIGYGSVKDPLPFEMRLGASRKFDLLLFSVDAVRQREGQFFGNIGAEAFVMKEFKLRAGFTTLNRYSAGLGFATDSFSLDYAFSPFSSLSGDVHRFSLDVKFGRKAARAKKTAKPELDIKDNQLRKQFEKLQEEKTKQENRKNIEIKEEVIEGGQGQVIQAEPEIQVKEEAPSPAAPAIKDKPKEEEFNVTEEK